jgi:hypothetical protein
MVFCCVDDMVPSGEMQTALAIQCKCILRVPAYQAKRCAQGLRESGA